MPMSSPGGGKVTVPSGNVGVADLVQLLLEDRRKREDELADERAR